MAVRADLRARLAGGRPDGGAVRALDRADVARRRAQPDLDRHPSARIETAVRRRLRRGACHPAIRLSGCGARG